MEDQNILEDYIIGLLLLALGAPYLRVLTQKRLDDVHKNSKNPLKYIDKIVNKV